jgi:4-azaleucine resistance transporter AzlC
MSPFWKAVKTTLPVFLAYFPLGVVFGLLFQQVGYLWFLAPIASILIFGGSLQFLALTLAALPVAGRNSFYGLSLIDRFRGSWLRKGYLAFGLVDATYSLLTTEQELEGEDDDRFVLWVTILNHAYWVVGTLLGAVLGLLFMFNLPGAEFVLTALFVVLLIDQYYKIGKITPFLIAGIALVLALVIAPVHLLLVGVGVASAILITWEAVA